MAETYNDSNAVENYRMKEAELKEAKVINKVRRAINDIPEPDTVDEYIKAYEKNISILGRFADVVAAAKEKEDLLHIIVAAEKFNSDDGESKQKLLQAAEQYITKDMVEKLSLSKALCAVMLLYEKVAEEEAELWEE